MNRPAKCQMWANVSAPQACPSAGSLRSPDTHGGRCPRPLWLAECPPPPRACRFLWGPRAALPRSATSPTHWPPFKCASAPSLSLDFLLESWVPAPAGRAWGRTGWASTCGQSLPCPPRPQPCCLDGTATPRCRGGGFPAHRQPCCPRGTATAWVSGRRLTRPQPLGLSSGLS